MGEMHLTAAATMRRPTARGVDPSLLNAASDPIARLSALLAAILDRALAISTRTVGGAVVVMEPPPHEAIVHRLALQRIVPVLLSWVQDPRSPVFVPRAGCSDVGPAVLSSLGVGADSSALVAPLVEHRTRYGLILVELSRDGDGDTGIRLALERLASDATGALRRFQAREHSAQRGFELDLVGVSPGFLNLEHQAKLAAVSSRASVLLLGERGTGKEMIARSIHAWSDRRGAPFVPVLASGLAETLLPDELYGHARHAFTGAGGRRAGKFQAADGGTLFLDEVADMPPGTQSMLLRVAERGEIQPVGADGPDTVNVRIISATNVDLRRRVEQAGFRADLFDRLSIFEIHVPPLRERLEDIPLMARYFARKYCAASGRSATCPFADTHCSWESAGTPCVSPEFLDALLLHDWPGNVRELANLMQRLVVTAGEEILDRRHLPALVGSTVCRGGAGVVQEGRSADAEMDLSLESAIRRHIERVLEIASHRQSRAARLLNLPYSTLQSTMKRLGIRVRRDRAPPA
jgi:two-component system, NtrC family, nitrogen regulation response regulator NtrX